jgi:hypothetical protein
LHLGEIFDHTSKKMRTDFDEILHAVPHRGERGRSVEEVVRQFLEKYFPKTLDLFTGFIVDSNGKVSNQIDIIVSDRSKTPIFYENESIRVVPVECVYSVIEVKSFLDSKELQKCFKNGDDNTRPIQTAHYVNFICFFIDRNTAYVSRFVGR